MNMNINMDRPVRRGRNALWPAVALVCAALLSSLAVVRVAGYRPEDIMTYDNPLWPGTLALPQVDFFTYPAGLAPTVRLSGVFAQQLVMGRCPEEYKGCYDPINDRTLGCCHVNQTCAMRLTEGPRHNAVFLGCVDDPLQLCYNQMCPPGYGCCRSTINVIQGLQRRMQAFCVPFDPSTGWVFDPAVYGPYPPDVAAAAGNFSDFCGNAASVPANGLTPPYLALFQPWTMFDAATGQYIADTCTGPYGGFCAAGDVCNTQVVVNGQNRTTGEIIVETQETFCCPTGQSLCLVGRPPYTEWEVGTPLNISQQFQSTQFLGCAIDARNETCCGSSICNGESVCCIARNNGTYFDNNSTLSYAYNATAASYCCPAATQCCYGIPKLVPEPGVLYNLLLDGGTTGREALLPSGQTAPSLPTGAYGYCGAPYQGVDCAIDVMLPQGWMLAQLMFPTELP